MEAALRNYADITQHLVDHGARPYDYDINMQSVISCAASNGNTHIMSILLGSTPAHAEKAIKIAREQEDTQLANDIKELVYKRSDAYIIQTFKETSDKGTRQTRKIIHRPFSP